MSSTAETVGLDVRPVAGHIGAEIRGFNRVRLHWSDYAASGMTCWS
jgi:hypothetical protein